jgi:hypothetical protein
MENADIENADIENADIENAKAVCAQAILHRSTDKDPILYYAVYHSRTQRVFVCLCDPSKQTFEEVEDYSMDRGANQVANRLKEYIGSNAVVLWPDVLRRRERH